MSYPRVTVEADGEVFRVCFNGVAAGSMFDFFGIGELRNPYPFRKHKNQFETMAAAEEVAEMVHAHIAEVVALPKKRKAHCSAQHWKL